MTRVTLFILLAVCGGCVGKPDGWHLDELQEPSVSVDVRLLRGESSARLSVSVGGQPIARERLWKDDSYVPDCALSEDISVEVNGVPLKGTPAGPMAVCVNAASSAIVGCELQSYSIESIPTTDVGEISNIVIREGSKVFSTKVRNLLAPRLYEIAGAVPTELHPGDQLRFRWSWGEDVSVNVGAYLDTSTGTVRLPAEIDGQRVTLTLPADLAPGTAVLSIRGSASPIFESCEGGVVCNGTVGAYEGFTPGYKFTILP